MPYIKPKLRAQYDNLIEVLSLIINQNSTKEKRTPCGDLNYVITMLLENVYTDADNYKDFNEKIGILECAKLELYRTRVAPYEDEKIKTNGDVYPFRNEN